MDLRFLEREGKKILQVKRVHHDWIDVPLEKEAKPPVTITSSQFWDACSATIDECGGKAKDFSPVVLARRLGLGAL